MRATVLPGRFSSWCAGAGLLLMQDQLRVTPRLCLTVVHPDGECLAKLSWFISRSQALQLQRRTRGLVEQLLLKWLLLPELVPWPVNVSHRTWKAFTRLRSRGLSNHHSRTKRLSQKKRRSNVVEIVSGLADGAGSMPAKWSRRVFWLRSYEGKISCESFELAGRGDAIRCGRRGVFPSFTVTPFRVW